MRAPIIPHMTIAMTNMCSRVTGNPNKKNLHVDRES